MKYRITTRGWIVFSALGILVIALIISLFNQSEDSTSAVDQNDLVVEATETTDENETEETSSDADLVEDTSEDTTGVEETSEESTESSDDQEETTDVVEETETVDIDLSKESTILFDKNIAELDSTYFTELNEWIDLLMDNDYTITVEGHINGYPYYEDGNYGLTIAENRAQIVKDYFIDNGIKSERVIIVNMGSNKQVSNEKDFHLNRRAVIYFNEKP